jgi:hypothetical protein
VGAQDDMLNLDDVMGVRLTNGNSEGVEID